MDDRPNAGLDNQTFNGRLRQPNFRDMSARPYSDVTRARPPRPISGRRVQPTGLSQLPVRPHRVVNDVAAPQKNTSVSPPQGVEPPTIMRQPIAVQSVPPAALPVAPKPPAHQQMEAPAIQQQPIRSAVSFKQPAVAPLQPEPQPTQYAPAAKPDKRRRFRFAPNTSHIAKLLARLSRRQLAAVGMVGIVLLVGLVVGLQQLRGEKSVAAGSAERVVDQGVLPNTNQPNPEQVKQYNVAADLARYVRIPKLGVSGRVFEAGTDRDGSIGKPSNVFDAAWYSGSAKPGTVGTTVLNGYTSSWTTNGLFYNLNKLSAGDRIQIERGDGKLLEYQVVSTQVYDANTVDMQTAMTAAQEGKSGLNIVTSTGKVKPGTNVFTQRLVVSTSLVK